MIPSDQFDNVVPNPEGMTTRAQQVLTMSNQPVAPAEEGKPLSPKDKKRHKEFRDRADLCRTYKRKLIANWNTSIDYRRGKPFAAASDEDQVAVPLDWPLTKAKVASLFSQVPKVRVDHPPQSLTSGPWVAGFENKVNDTLVMAGVEAAMDESLPDCVNAAGFGVVLVSYESITEDKSLPLKEGDPASGLTSIPQSLDHRYLAQRLSPSDFLWPIQFTGSNFDNAPWIGRSGRVSWSEAVQRFGLTQEDKRTVLGEDRTDVDRLVDEAEKDSINLFDQQVGFDELWYKEHIYHTEARSFSTIRHLVFVNGKDDPVVDEAWKGQRLDPKTNLPVGSMKYPVRVLQLTYITDEAIPPSDSAMGRSQVNEINRLRTTTLQQRQRSLPIRWFDPNRVDPMVQQALMKGTWQNMVPIQGDGGRAMGEVSRAVYPNEDFMFYKTAQSDLAQIWTIGPNQLGSGEEVETKGESSEISQGFQTRIGRERAKVASFFVGIAEVLGGLMCLFEDPSVFGEGFQPMISQTLSYSILADSTVLVDAQQRLERINKFINMYAKSGWVNLEPVLKEAATLSGLDPNTTIQAPKPKPPVEPNISLRLTGAEDMMNPLLLAFLIQSGQAPKPEFIETAKQLIQQAVINQPPAPPEVGPDGQPVGPPPPAPPAPGEANPDMAAMPKINKRSNAPAESM